MQRREKESVSHDGIVEGLVTPKIIKLNCVRETAKKYDVDFVPRGSRRPSQGM